MSDKIKIQEIKKYLSEYSKDELIKDILKLVKDNTFVHDYYSTKLSPKSEIVLLKKYKDIIRNEFFPAHGFGKVRLSVAKKAITEFKKLSDRKEYIAELMMFYVENGVEFTLEYGDIDEAFYLSMESMYERCLKFIMINNLEKRFQERCEKVMHDTDGIGWGFHDQLSELYYTYLDNF